VNDLSELDEVVEASEREEKVQAALAGVIAAITNGRAAYDRLCQQAGVEPWRHGTFDIMTLQLASLPVVEWADDAARDVPLERGRPETKKARRGATYVGRGCIRGHVDGIRYIRTGDCVECAKAKSIALSLGRAKKPPAVMYDGGACSRCGQTMRYRSTSHCVDCHRADNRYAKRKAKA
jgi:hypothetical protein